MKSKIFARMGDISITVGDLFTCGKASIDETPPVVAVLISKLVPPLRAEINVLIYRKLRSFLAYIRL